MFAQRISVLTIAFVITASTAYAEGYVALPADDQAVDAACTADAVTTGCIGQLASHGLVGCMQEYRAANSSFAYSAGCKAAMIKRNAHKKAQ